MGIQVAPRISFRQMYDMELGQWLHHAQHLAHVGLRLLEDALQSILVQLTTWFIVFTRSGQGSKLNDILGFGFMVYLACHPLKDPSLWIPVVASNVVSCIEL